MQDSFARAFVEFDRGMNQLLPVDVDLNRIEGSIYDLPRGLRFCSAKRPLSEIEGGASRGASFYFRERFNSD